MTSNESLLTLLAHAERECNAAMANAKRIEDEHRQAQRQCEHLQSYRDNFERRWSQQFSQSGGIDIVQCYQNFAARLGQAIEVQERVTRLAALRLEQARQQWQHQEVRVVSVRKLIERRGRELRDVDNLREQKQLDEHAARALWNRAAGADSVTRT